MSAPIRAAEQVPAVGIHCRLQLARVLELARDVLAREAASIVASQVHDFPGEDGMTRLGQAR